MRTSETWSKTLRLAGEGKILAEMRRHIDAKQDWKGLGLDP